MGALSDYLTADHARLDGLLAAALADPLQLDQGAFEQFRAGLLRHIGVEEKLLLPEARRRRGGEPLAVAATLRVEHAALVSLLVPTPDHALGNELAALLGRHNAREEGPGALYEVCEALLQDEADALVERARAVQPPPMARHFDGSGVFRTAADALRAAEQSAARKLAR